MLKRVLVLGTGTAVGKTWLTAALARALRRQAPGCLVVAAKPVESGLGVRHEAWRVVSEPAGADSQLGAAPSDALLLEQASGLGPLGIRGLDLGLAGLPHPLYALRAPLSPHLAAEGESRTIELDALEAWVDELEARLMRGLRSLADWQTQRLQPESQQDELYTTLHATAHGAGLRVGAAAPAGPTATPGPGQGRERPSADTSPLAGLLLLETAGGAFSPLGLNLSNAQLAVALGPAATLLVAPDRLGVLHDVTAARLGLSRAGLEPTHIVLNQLEAAADASSGTNLHELERLEQAGYLSSQIQANSDSEPEKAWSPQSRPPRFFGVRFEQEHDLAALAQELLVGVTS